MDSSVVGMGCRVVVLTKDGLKYFEFGLRMRGFWGGVGERCGLVAGEGGGDGSGWGDAGGGVLGGEEAAGMVELCGKVSGEVGTGRGSSGGGKVCC